MGSLHGKHLRNKCYWYWIWMKSSHTKCRSTTELPFVNGWARSPVSSITDEILHLLVTRHACQRCYETKYVPYMNKCSSFASKKAQATLLFFIQSGRLKLKMKDATKMLLISCMDFCKSLVKRTNWLITRSYHCYFWITVIETLFVQNDG